MPYDQKFVAIRPAMVSDAEELYALIAKRRSWLSGLKWAASATLESTRAHLEHAIWNEKFRLVTYNTAIVGVITLRGDKDNYCIGYWSAAYRRRGMMSYAVSLFLRWIREPIAATVREQNIASLTILQQNDFEIVDVSDGWVTLNRAGFLL